MRASIVKFRMNILNASLLLLGILICLPVLLVFTGSFIDGRELRELLKPLLTEGEGLISWKLMPDYPTFAHYGRLLFQTPQFFVLFWNSVKLTVCILAGQLLIGVPAAWAFAVYPFRGGNKLFTLYIVLMLLPFQVTMLSNYLVLDRLRLMDTHAAVILPAVFSTFPIFLCYRGFRAIPRELLDAARVDGAGEGRIFCRVGLPLGIGGIRSALVLGFLECWNLMEQPLSYLKDPALWPLSLYLPQIRLDQAGFALAASAITLVPAGFVFYIGQDDLEKGILYAGLKA